MPSYRFSDVEGAGLPLDLDGTGRRRRSSWRDPRRSHLHVSRRFVGRGKNCSWSDPPVLASGRGCLSPSSNCKEFKTKEPRDVFSMRVAPSTSTVQLFLLCLVSIHCCALFYGSCLSAVPNWSPSTDDGTLLPRASSAAITSADLTEAAAPDRANAFSDRIISRKNPAYSSSGIRPPGLASRGATIGIAGSENATPATSVSTFYEGSTDAAPSGGLESSSLLSLGQTSAVTLPAGYQTYREMLGLLRALASSCPELKLTERIHGQTKIDVISLKRTAPADNKNESRVKLPRIPQQRIFILSGEHPRELIPPAVLVRFVQLVCGAQPPAVSVAADAENQQQTVEETEDKSFKGEGGKRQREEEITIEKQAQGSAQEDSSGSKRSSRNGKEQDEDGGREGDLRRYPKLLDNAEFEIVINANPLAREKVEEGSFCRRGTLTNVDLNRNWSAFWEADTREEPDSRTEEPNVAPGETAAAAGENLTGGPSPFSEPETQLLRQVLLQFQPTLFISLHSGQLGIFTPFGHTDRRPAVHGQRLKEIAEKVAHNPYCRNPNSSSRCVTGIAGKFFSAKGNCLDWVYTTILPTPLAFLMEIYKAEGTALPNWQEQPELPFTEMPEYGETVTQTKEEEESQNVGSPLTGIRANSELQTQAQQRFTLIQTGGDTNTALKQHSAWGVRTPENTFSPQRTPLRPSHSRTSRLAQINPHFSFASLKQKMMYSNRGSERAARLSSREGTVSLSSGTPSLSNHSSKQNNNATVGKASKTTVSLLDVKQGSSVSAVAGALEQTSSSVRTPEECFRLFNPHSHTSREEALNGWSEVLLQLITEVQSTAALEEKSTF